MFNLITYLIVIFGGINWFCIGLFQFDIIAGIFGSQAHFVSRFLYCIIGICAICSIIALPIKKGRIYEPKKKKKQEETSEQEEQEEDDAPNTNEQNTDNEKEQEEDIDEIVIKTKPKAKAKKRITKIKKDL